MTNMGRWFLLAGLFFVAVGLILSFAPGVFSWFGRLPGDIRLEDERGSLFIPITSMIVVSLILTLIVNLFLRR